MDTEMYLHKHSEFHEMKLFRKLIDLDLHLSLLIFIQSDLKLRA